MSQKPETRIQVACQVVFKKKKAFVIKTHGDRYTRPGIPDLIACVPTTIEELSKIYSKTDKIGIFVGVENKTTSKLKVFDTERQTQEIVGKEIINAGGIWFVTDNDKDVEEVLERLQGK
jgi:hypothetical protein